LRASVAALFKSTDDELVVGMVANLTGIIGALGVLDGKVLGITCCLEDSLEIVVEDEAVEGTVLIGNLGETTGVTGVLETLGVGVTC